MGLKKGSSGEVVTRWQQTMVRRFGSYAREADGSPLRIDGYFGNSDAAVQQEYQRRTGQTPTGEVSDADLAALKLIAAPRPRHACLTFRGTWGVVGQDYTSRVAQACAAVVEEVPVPYAATFGPIGGAIDAPSYRQSINQAVEWAAHWIETSTRSFLLGGYSQGGEAASRVRALLEPGGRLAAHRHRYVAGYTFGNPCRRFGHTFYLGAIPGGEGISDFHLPESACTWDWLDCAQSGDIYTNVPLGDIGEVCRRAYALAIDMQFNDGAALVKALVANLVGLLDEAGVDADAVPANLLTGALSGLLAALLPGLAPAGDPEAAAAVQAAVLGIRFATANPPTAPHITYEFAEAVPGRTFLNLAIQHVTDWASRTPAAA